MIYNSSIIPMLQTLSLIVLFLVAVGAVRFVPESPWRHLDDPVYQALPAAALLLLRILGARVLGHRARRMEPWLFAIFLAAMPMVYVSSFVRSGHGGWVWSELLGLLLYATPAILGIMKSPWLLALGILGHGLFWDLWHHGRSAYVPNWYADACLLVDLGFGFYAAAHVRYWRALK